MTKDKPQLFLDFDDTLTNTLETVVDYLNIAYNTDYVADDIKTWDFHDKFPTINDDIKDNLIANPFESEYFWNHLTLKPNVINALKELQKYYELFIVSKGEKKNLQYKYEFIKQNFTNKGVEAQFIPLKLNESKRLPCCKKNSIAIDDNVHYLRESNATLKILFRSFNDVEWNKDWDDLEMSSWDNLTIKGLIALGGSK